MNDKRVDELTGQRRRFSSAILPAWCRRSPKIGEVLPLLYLLGLSCGDFVPALEQVLGSAAGLSAATVTRLTGQWQDEQRAFAGRDLSGVDYVYVWADGVHVNIRLEEHKLCLLVVIGARADGSKELVALADGYRESVESWADLLRDAKRRGMGGPGARRRRRCAGIPGWAARGVRRLPRAALLVHKTGDVLAALPRSAPPAAKKALAEIWGAEDKTHALPAVKAFEAAYARSSTRPSRRSPTTYFYTDLARARAHLLNNAPDKAVDALYDARSIAPLHFANSASVRGTIQSIASQQRRANRGLRALANSVGLQD